MAEKDRDDALDKLSLDRPKLFGRRKGTAAPQPNPGVAPTPASGPEQDVVAPAPEPVAGDTHRFAPPGPTPEPAPAPAPVPDRAPAPAAAPAAAPAPAPAPPAHAKAPAAPTPGTRTEDEPVRAATDSPRRSAAALTALRAKLPSRSEPGTAGERSEPRERWTPPVAGVQAVAVVGLLVGVLIYGLSLGTLKACEVVRGTSSCGGAGYLFLMAILVAAALVGGWALGRCSIPDPRATALLAVGIVAVVVLLVLVPVLFSWTMVLVIPLLATLAFLGSHAIAGVDIDEGQRWQPEDDDTVARLGPRVTPPTQADRTDAGHP